MHLQNRQTREAVQLVRCPRLHNQPAACRSMQRVPDSVSCQQCPCPLEHSPCLPFCFHPSTPGHPHLLPHACRALVVAARHHIQLQLVGRALLLVGSPGSRHRQLHALQTRHRLRNERQGLARRHMWDCGGTSQLGAKGSTPVHHLRLVQTNRAVHTQSAGASGLQKVMAQPASRAPAWGSGGRAPHSPPAAAVAQAVGATAAHRNAQAGLQCGVRAACLWCMACRRCSKHTGGQGVVGALGSPVAGPLQNLWAAA